MPVRKLSLPRLVVLSCILPILMMSASPVVADEHSIGSEHAIDRHLKDGEEFTLSIARLLEFGKAIFAANWTIQDGAGRPLTKGTGAPLSDPTRPLVFPDNFNRISGPDSNSCAGCHNAPFGIAGGGGDIVANVFVLGQRFDFATMDGNDALDGVIPTRGALDERGRLVTLQSIANSRATLGMFGSGYIEMLARQITSDLIRIRDSVQPGRSASLVSKGISFGTLTRRSDGTWDTSQVTGLPSPSLAGNPPNLLIRPFHQAGAVISLRQFSNNAFNHHHGMQSEERFGIGLDPDGDGVVNELTRADITAASLYQAALPVPGRRIPRDPKIEQAVWRGEQLFASIGCASCHIPQLPLDNHGWVFSEPNPFNPPGNLRPGDAAPVSMDLNSDELPSPRLAARNGVTLVPAYTDLKLHDICDGPDDPNVEPLDMLAAAGSAQFFAGNRRFLTRKLWGTANEPPFFHHGKFTTLREAVLAHGGEARDSRQHFRDLSDGDRNAVIEFLKTLQVLPPGTKSLIVDEEGHARKWPPGESDQ